jgi:hypothetical protein
MSFNRTTKNVIWGNVINYNSSKFLHDAVILKDRRKNRKLIFSVMTKHLLESKKDLLLFLIVRDKVGADYEKKSSI